MLEIAKVYYDFWQQVLPAYVEYEVPGDAKLPYLTYTIGRGSFGADELQQVRIWTNSESYESLWKYTREIEKIIPEAGTMLRLPEGKGALYLYRGTPFVQYTKVPDEEYNNLKTAYVNIVVRTYAL